MARVEFSRSTHGGLRWRDRERPPGMQLTLYVPDGDDDLGEEVRRGVEGHNNLRAFDGVDEGEGGDMGLVCERAECDGECQ